MKHYKIISVVGCVIATVMTFAGSCSLAAFAETWTVPPAESSCGDKLRHSMDEMHHRMQAVETTGEADEDFVRLMVPHHQAAVEMAQIELVCGTDSVNRRLAQEIIVEQQSEIDLMNLWLSKRPSQKTPDHGAHHSGEATP